MCMYEWERKEVYAMHICIDFKRINTTKIQTKAHSFGTT